MLDLVQEASLIRRVSRKVYWNSRYARLRTQIDEDDLIQMVFLKLLHRDNYKKYSDKYPKAGFIYRVANGCAIAFANKKFNLKEWTVLDQPKDSEDERTLMDILASTEAEVQHIDIDRQLRLNRVAASMNPKINKHVVIRHNDEDIPFSIEAFFDFFINTHYSKREMMPCIINVKTNTPVTQTTFDKWWGILEKTAQKELSRM